MKYFRPEFFWNFSFKNPSKLKIFLVRRDVGSEQGVTHSYMPLDRTKMTKLQPWYSNFYQNRKFFHVRLPFSSSYVLPFLHVIWKFIHMTSKMEHYKLTTILELNFCLLYFLLIFHIVIKLWIWIFLYDDY